MRVPFWLCAELPASRAPVCFRRGDRKQAGAILLVSLKNPVCVCVCACVRACVCFPLVAQTVKNLPAMQETSVQSLDEEDPWRRKWQPTPVFLLGKFLEQRSLAGHSPWACKESDLTMRITHAYISNIYLILNFMYFCFS